MSQTRIIFLDIDGVLNNPSPTKRIGHFDTRNIESLNKLVFDTKAKIVLTCSLRIIMTYSTIAQAMAYSGFRYPEYVIGATKDLRYGEAGDCILRGNEILHWIKTHEEIIGCKYHLYNQYVILDDESDMLFWQRNNFLHVNPYCGLGDREIFCAKKIFGLDPEQ